MDCPLQRIILHFLQLNFLLVKTLQIVAHNSQWVSHTFISLLKLFLFYHDKSHDLPFWMNSLIFFEILTYDQVFKRRFLTKLRIFLRQFVIKWLIIVLANAYFIRLTKVPFGVQVGWLMTNDLESWRRRNCCFYHLVISRL